MNHDRAEELRKTIKRGSEIVPARARCARCLRMFHAGEIHEGLCEPCTQAAKDEVAQSTLRRQVYERDLGVCAACSIDTEALREELDELRAVGGVENHRRRVARVHFFVRLGFPRRALEEGETLWEADHVDERVAGGASSLENAQTLCRACHDKKSKSFASKRAASRRPRR